MIKILIVEDEVISSNYIVSLLEKHYTNKFTVEKELDSILDTVSWLNKNETPDLMFMDIQLSDGICFEIFNQIEISCPIIFTTAYDKYAIRAFKTNGIDYLLKPILENDFSQAIDKFLKLRRDQEKYSLENDRIRALQLNEHKIYKDRFLVKLGTKYTPIQIKDIAYFYKDEITFAKSFNGSVYPLNNSLSHIENSIDLNLFFRANRTFLVNLNAIEYLSQYKPGQLTIKVKPKFEEVIVLSQEKSSNLKALLN